MDVFLMAMATFVTMDCKALTIDVPVFKSAFIAEGFDPDEYKTDVAKHKRAIAMASRLSTRRASNCAEAVHLFGPEGIEIRGIVRRK